MPVRTNTCAPDEIGPLFDADGRIDQAVAADFLVVPSKVLLDGGRLMYAYSSGRALAHGHSAGLSVADCRDPEKMSKLGLPLLKAAGPGLLDGFLSLCDGTDDDVLAFARKWGVLDLCEHELPYTHNVGSLRWGVPRNPICSPLRLGKARSARLFNYGIESTAAWRRWSLRARGLMRIAANLSSGRVGAEEDWKSVMGGQPTFASVSARFPAHGTSAADDRFLLCLYVNDWCAMAQLSPHLASPAEGSIVLRFGSGSRRGLLFAMLGLQMMARISTVGSVAVCSSCGVLYKPRRVPDPSRLNFCRKCGRGASVEHAKQRLSDRRRAARQEFDKGRTPTETAASIGSKAATVMGWFRRWEAGSK